MRKREEVRMTAILGVQLNGELFRDMQCYPPSQPAKVYSPRLGYQSLSLALLCQKDLRHDSCLHGIHSLMRRR